MLVGCVQGANYDGGVSKARTVVACFASLQGLYTAPIAIQDFGHVLAFVTAHAAHLLWHYFAKLRQFVIVVVARNIFVSHQNIDNYM